MSSGGVGIWSAGTTGFSSYDRAEHQPTDATQTLVDARASAAKRGPTLLSHTHERTDMNKDQVKESRALLSKA